MENEMLTAGNDFAGDLIGTTQNKKIFCSLPMTTEEEKKLAFNAMSSPDMSIKEAINLPIDLTDIYCETADVMDKKTGEIKEMPRLVLIDTEGKSYQAVSFGLYRAIMRLISIYGNPTWNPPIPVTIKQVGPSDKQTYSIVIR